MTKYVIEIPDSDMVKSYVDGYVSRSGKFCTIVREVKELKKFDDEVVKIKELLGIFEKENAKLKGIIRDMSVVKSIGNEGNCGGFTRVNMGGYADELDDYGGDDVW